jgi:hypothetical protein
LSEGGASNFFRGRFSSDKGKNFDCRG